MAQKIPFLAFIKKQLEISGESYTRQAVCYKIMRQLICDGCADKAKKRFMCLRNNVGSLNLKENTCAKYIKREDI